MDKEKVELTIIKDKQVDDGWRPSGTVYSFEAKPHTFDDLVSDYGKQFKEQMKDVDLSGAKLNLTIPQAETEIYPYRPLTEMEKLELTDISE